MHRDLWLSAQHVGVRLRHQLRHRRLVARGRADVALQHPHQLTRIRHAQLDAQRLGGQAHRVEGHPDRLGVPAHRQHTAHRDGHIAGRHTAGSRDAEVVCHDLLGMHTAARQAGVSGFPASHHIGQSSDARSHTVGTDASGIIHKHMAGDLVATAAAEVAETVQAHAASLHSMLGSLTAGQAPAGTVGMGGASGAPMSSGQMSCQSPGRRSQRFTPVARSIRAHGATGTLERARQLLTVF